MNTCRAKCINYKVTTSKYIDGVAFCRHCHVMIKHEGKYCPCCSHLLRRSCRYTKGKNKVYAM